MTKIELLVALLDALVTANIALQGDESGFAAHLRLMEVLVSQWLQAYATEGAE